jgi:glycosyltransferase involved in cell wall biosynthesis
LKVSKKLSGKRIFVSHGLSKHIFHFCEKPFWGLGPWLKGLKWSFSFLPRIFQAHDAFVFLADKSDWGRFFDLKICKNFFPGRTWIIPNTITDLHLARKSPSVRTSLLGGRSLLLVYVANFCDRKDQLRAVRIFTNSGLRNSVLVLVGTEANEYSHLVSGWIRRNKHRLDLQDQQILVYTGLSRKKTLDFTASSDLVLLTAKSETQPLVLIEAMALKKPWVSTISGCIDKMKGGLPCRTDYQLIEAVRRLSQSKILRQSLVAEGTRAYAKYYSPKVFVCGWERLIKVISPQHP